MPIFFASKTQKRPLSGAPKIISMINSMYNHNGNDITKNKPVHVIMVLVGYVDIGDSSVNAHLLSLSRAFIVLHTNIAR